MRLNEVESKHYKKIKKTNQQNQLRKKLDRIKYSLVGMMLKVTFQN